MVTLENKQSVSVENASEYQKSVCVYKIACDITIINVA